jgi:hypothetical protein
MKSAVCPPTAAADAALASVNDNPAAPNTGRAFRLRFRLVGACFARNMWPPIPSDKIRSIDRTHVVVRAALRQGSAKRSGKKGRCQSAEIEPTLGWKYLVS